MASEPVRSTAIEAAPKDYSIPAAQQIRLLSVRASFTDNGAASDWLPALQILDNNGNVLVTAADQGVKVTAGSDADVSWFPGVKVAAAAAAAGTMSYAHGYNNTVQGDPNIVVNAGANKNAPFAHVSTSNAAVMSWSTFISGNDQLDLKVDGLYLCYGAAQFDIGGANMAAFPFKSGAAGELPNDSWDNLDPNNFVDPAGLSTNQGYTIYNRVGGTPSSTHLFLQNTGGVAANTVIAGLAVIYLGVPA